MTRHIFYNSGHTAAMAYAEANLWRMGCRFTATPDSSVTHLLLGVPAFQPNGALKGGGNINQLLSHFREDVTIIGGNLPKEMGGHPTVDLLQDDLYLAENADITAHCALKLILQKLPITLKGCPVLIIGWGRIGKCLAKLLADVGAAVTVAARKSSDRAMLSALGYTATDLTVRPEQYRLIVNTVPAPVLTGDQLTDCCTNCLKIDLASVQGIDAEDVIWARGLPNSHAPETSGALIAQSILRLI